MKLPTTLHVVTWLSLAVIVSPREATRTRSYPLQVVEEVVEEREVLTRKDMEEYLESKEDLSGPIIELAKSTFGGIVTLSKIDYTQSGGQVAWEVAEAVVPMIGAALALIPAVGPIVSGIFLGLWSVISPLFAPKKDNPIEKMVKELAKKMEQKMDDKLSSVINRAIYGEIARNNYICSKYSIISHFFSNQLNSSEKLRDVDALKLMVYLDNCDNFLKDTAEAFVYNEYADILWIPGAITTSTRLGFLAEIIRYGSVLGMNRNVTAIYFKELKKDIQRQFEFYGKGMSKGWAHAQKKDFDKNKKYFSEVTQVEKAACRLQSQYFYFDRLLYTYGMPEILNDADMFTTINMEDHYNPQKDGSIKHLQLFFNVSESNFASKLPARKDPYLAMEFLNCFLGPMHLISPSTFWFNFKTMPEKRYSYEFRIMFLEMTFGDDYEHSVPLLVEHDKKSDKFKEYLSVHKKVFNNEDAKTKTCLNIEFVFPLDKRFNESKQLIDVPGSSYFNKCPYVKTYYPLCNRLVNTFYGRFKSYSAGTFNHKDETVNPLISIEDPSRQFVHYSGSRYNRHSAGFLVGAEIIVRPRIK